MQDCKNIKRKKEKKHSMESLAKYCSCSTQRPLTGSRKEFSKRYIKTEKKVSHT